MVLYCRTVNMWEGLGGIGVNLSEKKQKKICGRLTSRKIPDPFRASSRASGGV